MDNKLKEAILQQQSALRLFMVDDRAFYAKYCQAFTDRIIREKRILEFENPNRVKVTYEYDVVAGDTCQDDMVFLFLPDKRKSWMKIFFRGQRLTIPDSSCIKQHLLKVVEDDLKQLQGTLKIDQTIDSLWDEIWAERKSIPCYIYTKAVEASLTEGGIMEITFYDFLNNDKTDKHCRISLFKEKYYEYEYPKVAKGNSWLYVKSPSRFDIKVDYAHSFIEKNDEHDPEISSYTLKWKTGAKKATFKIAVKVPMTLKVWYGWLIILGVAFVLCFIGVFIAAIRKGVANSVSPVYAQVGICIIAAIIATRGWLMKEETVLGRVSYWFTGIMIFIVVMLLAGYSWIILGV